MSLTKDELVAVANQEARQWDCAAVSSRTVSDWIDEGLLPKGLPIGRGRGKNPTWHYPDEASDMVRLIVKLRGFGTTRSTAVRLQLWSRGYDFPIEVIRKALKSEFRRFVGQFERLARWSFDHRNPSSQTEKAFDEYRRSMGGLDPDIAAIGIQLPRKALLIAGSFLIHGGHERLAALGYSATDDEDALACVAARLSALLAQSDETDHSGLERLAAASEEQLIAGRYCFQLIEPTAGICAALAGILFPVMADRINLVTSKIINSFYRPDWHMPFLVACILAAPSSTLEASNDAQRRSGDTTAIGR